METFHLFHLASVWKPITRTASPQQVQTALPSQDRPVRTTFPAGQLSASLPDYSSDIVHDPQSRIRAAAVQMVYAQRNSLDVIIPEESDKLELWVGKAVLDCLTQVEISKNVRNLFLSLRSFNI
jgi:uridine phosphorylase